MIIFFFLFIIEIRQIMLSLNKVDGDDYDHDVDDYDNDYDDDIINDDHDHDDYYDDDGDDVYGCTSIGYDRYRSGSVLEVSFDPPYHLPIYLRYIM